MPPPTVPVVTRDTLERLVKLDLAALAAVEESFTWLGRAGTAMPPVMRMDLPGAEVDVKTAYVPGLPGFAVKIATGFYENPARGLPSTGGLMVVFDATSGVVQAVLIDGGYLTEVRTALAGAVAARHLALPDASTVAVFGAGSQARLQVRALSLVRPLRKVSVWARRPEAAERCAREIEADLGIPCAAASAEEAARGAAVVITATPATEPILRGSWLAEGAHVTAMGADAPHKRELDDEVFARASVFVCDSRSQAFTIGEMQHTRISAERVVELGELVTKTRTGRPDARAITVCDLSGVGLQDTAISLFALERWRTSEGTAC